MAHKISVYVDPETHRVLKNEAILRGKSLSEFVAEAAISKVHAPRRDKASVKMDQIRNSSKGNVSTEEVRNMRHEGRCS